MCVRDHIAHRNLAHHARIFWVSYVYDTGRETLAVGDVADVGVIALNVDLACALQVEMAEAGNLVGEFGGSRLILDVSLNISQ